MDVSFNFNNDHLTHVYEKLQSKKPLSRVEKIELGKYLSLNRYGKSQSIIGCIKKYLATKFEDKYVYKAERYLEDIQKIKSGQGNSFPPKVIENILRINNSLAVISALTHSHVKLNASDLLKIRRGDVPDVIVFNSEAQLMAEMQGLLSIRYSDSYSFEDEKICNEKKILMVSSIDLATIKLVVSQSAHIPFIQAAVRELANSFAQLDSSLDAEAIQKLHMQIRNQSENLKKCATLINDLKKDGKIDEATLSQLTIPSSLKMLPSNLRKPELSFIMSENEHALFVMLKPYFTGTETFKENDHKLEEVKIQLLKYAASCEEPKKVSAAELSQRRAKDSVSMTSLRMQARLQEIIRKSKAWVALQPMIIPQGTSVNDVYRLNSLETLKEVIAFYKEGHKGEEAAGIMEKLIWDSAVIFGVEEQFVATGEVKLRTKSGFAQREDGEEVKEKVWNEKGELVERVVKGEARRGGIQVAQTGITLNEYSELKPNKRSVIPRRELIKGSLAVAVFGMYDAHGGNIIIDKDGKIKFYDNTRSLPPSNGVIQYGINKRLISPFRSGLLDLPESYAPFTAEDRQMLKEEISGYKMKYEALKRFYASPATLQEIKKLPPGWMQTNDSLKAMQERIQLLEQGLTNPMITNLCELSLVSQPNLRFSAAMSFLCKVINRIPFDHIPSSEELIKEQQKYLIYNGYDSIEACIDLCSQYQIDPLMIKQWTDDPSLTFSDILTKICMCKESIDSVVAILHQNNLVASLEKSAKPDFKDVSRKDILEQISKNILKIFKELGVYPVSLSEDESLAELNRKSEVGVRIQVRIDNSKKPPQFTLFRKEVDGQITMKMLIINRDGKISFDGKIMSFSTLKTLLNIFVPPVRRRY